MRTSFNPGLGRSPGEGNRYPLQYPCLENPHGQRSLMRYRVWDRRESDMTEQLTLSQLHILQSIFRGLKIFFFLITKINLGIKSWDSLEITDGVIFFHKLWFSLAKN